MMGRRQFAWKVKLQRETGSTVTRVVRNFWSPDWEGIKAAVANCAQAMEQTSSKTMCVVTHNPVLMDE